MMRKHIPNLIFLAVVLLGAGLWTWSAKPWESPVERTYLLCEPCGTSEDEVVELILLAGTPSLSPLLIREEVEAALDKVDGGDLEQMAERAKCIRAILEAADVRY